MGHTVFVRPLVKPLSECEIPSDHSVNLESRLESKGACNSRLTMNKVSRMLNKFRGTLVGALVGDCLGSHYEGTSFILPWGK